MSNLERCVAALKLVPESKLGYAMAYTQGLISMLLQRLRRTAAGA